MSKRGKNIVVDIPRLLDIIASSMLRSRTLAIRELVQNAIGSGADRITLSLEHPPGARPTLGVLDNGIGMSEGDVDQYLLRIASGLNPIGQFGLGFFSSLGISNEVHVYTRRQREKALVVVLKVTRSAGMTSEFEELSCSDLDEAPIARVGIEATGTKVLLYDPVADDAGTPLSSRDVRDVIEKWLRFCPVPIDLNGERLTIGMEIDTDAQIAVNHAFAYEGREHGVVTGVVGVGEQGRVEVLKHYIFIDELARLDLQGVVNCDALNVTMERDGAMRDEVWRNIGLAVEGVIPSLASLVAQRPNKTQLESRFLQQCIKEWLQAGDPRALADPFRIVPLFRTIFGDTLSLQDVEEGVARSGKAYVAYERNQLCEDLRD